MNEKRMDSKKIGTAIRALRQEKRLSQQELANALFVDRTLVNKWEHGKANLTIHTLSLLIDILKWIFVISLPIKRV